MRAIRRVIVAAALLASHSAHAVIDCHDDLGNLAKQASVIVIATIDSIGSREMAPCPEPKAGMFFPTEFRCGALQTFGLHVERRLRGSTQQNIRVSLPGRFMGLTCDDPPTIEVGARIGVFLKREQDGFWVLSGVAGVFDVPSGDDEAFKTRIDAAARGERE